MKLLKRDETLGEDSRQPQCEIRYAVRHKDKFMLLHISNSKKELESKIERAYWLAQGIQPRGNNYTKEDFMKDMEKVKVTFEKIG